MKTINPSYSRLKKLKQAPALALIETPTTQAMLDGRAFHCAVLEPEKFKTDYFVFNDVHIVEQIGGGNPRATNKYKEWKAALPTTDKIILAKELNDSFTAIREKLQADKLFNYLTKNAIFEKKFTFKKEVAGDYIEVSLIPDVVNVEKKIIIELKSTQCAKKSKFQKDAANFDYHLQTGIYIEGCAAEYGGEPEEWDFYFLACELTEPYLYTWLQADSDFKNVGRYEFDVLMLLWKQCLETGFSGGYETFTQPDKDTKLRIEKLSLPSWKLSETVEFF